MKNLFLILNQAFLSLALLAYLAAQMRFGFRAPFWRTIGWRPLQTGHTPRAVAYLGLIFSGSPCDPGDSFLLGLQDLRQNAHRTIFSGSPQCSAADVSGRLLAPVLEETIFRGYIYPVVARSFGVTAGILVTGTLFGLLHASQLWGGWAQIALLILVGIVFTYARARTHTVLASYLLHVSYNSFLFLGFVVASHGFHQFPGAP